MEDMSDIAGGTDNPAFAIGDECSSEQQVTLHENTGSPGNNDVNPPTENGGHRHQQHNYVSQHYVEGTRAADGVQEGHYKNEMRIELPVSQPNAEKNSEPKLNGVHGNGNNNDASFLNNSVASVQVNDGVGKKEQIEAVNLELVSMRPYTGNNLQTKGQEACEVPADPYEEYFVPVNEHRKYIRGAEAEVETTVAGVRFDLGPGVGREGLSLRDPAAGLVDYSHWLTALRGEKLYVTKDKRSRSSYWRRMACWGCGLLVLAVAIVIAILAATGTILTQEATEALTNVDHQSRHFGGAQAAGSQEYVKNPPSSPAPETSTFPPWPTTDETLYHTIPNALDGIIKLDNLTWQPAMSNETTREFQQVATEVENQLKRMLRSTSDPPVVKVYKINEEGEVMFRISDPQLPTPEETQQMAEKALRENDQTIGPYHISRLQVGRLFDLCQHRDFGCAEECRFDYSNATFACSCTSGKTLGSNGKDCIDENDLSNVDMEEPGREVAQVAHDGHEHEETTSHGSDHSVSNVQKSTSTVTTTTPAATTVPEIPQHAEVEHSRAHDFNDDVWSHEYSKHSQAKASTEEAESATKLSAPEEPNHVEFMVPTTTEALSITEVEAAESHTKMFKETNNSETTLEPEHLTTLFNESETERKEGDEGLKVIPLSVPPSADANNSVNVEKVNTEANIVTVPMETTTVAMDNERRQEETTTLETNGETVTENGNVNSPAEGEHVMLISENEHSNGEENVEEHSTVSGGGNTNTMTTERNLDRSTAQPEENVVFTEDATEYPTSHPLYPAVFQENNVNHDDGNDETHVEDMSPFLPDVHKEKETSKKAPRLDKDEQDVPNPFETHIEDVVINQPETNSTAEITESPDASRIPDGQLNNVTEIGEDKKESLDASEDISKIESDLQNQVQQNGLLREDSDIQKNSSDIETFNSTPNNEREETTTVAMEELETTVQSAENDTTTSSSVKPDDNAVEDNYNDIVDETLPKTFKHEDSEVITEPTQQNRVNDSERGTESSGTSVVTTPSTNSSEDAKLTTQVPVLPIEIQQELSTTTESIDKSTEKIDAATASEESTTSESSTEGPNVVRTDIQAEANATVQTSTMNPMYSVETKTTTQVPILPEELQTTEHESLATTSMKPEETTNEATTSSADFTTTVVSNESTTMDDVEYNETTTTIDSSMTLITDNSTTYTTIANDLLSEINTNNISTEMTVTEMIVTEKDETSETNEDKESTTVSVDYTTSYPQIETTLTTTEDIRPVTEIINDTNVDYQYKTPFLTTTPKKLLLPDKTSDELSSPILSEEDLRVIPLEKFGAVSDSRSTERKEAAKYKYKVEKVRYLGDPSKEEEGVEVYGSEDEEKNEREERKDEQKEKNETEVKEENKDGNKEKSETEGKEENKDENKVKNETELKEENKNENKKNETEGKEENENENKENIVTENTLNSTTLFTTEISKESFTEIPENVTENTTNFDASVNSNLSSSISPHTEENTVRIPQLKFIHHIIDLISGNQSEEAANELEFKENTTMTELSNNSTAELKKYPSFIPVSEEIIEPQPVTEPFILLRNYSAYPAVTLTTLIAETTTTAAAAAASTTTKEELGDVPNARDDHFENTIINANETTPEQTSELMEETSTSTTTSTTHSISTDEYAQSITNFQYNRIFSKCTAGQFQCTNGTARDGAYCVSLSSKCDSENDCSDGSDELNCEAEGCPGNFQCANAQCLKRHLVCNGIVDCDDGSDEINCQNWTCNFDEFQCTSGRCIPMLWKCNGRPDCEDHRDEYSCAESCANNEYLCPMEKWCIPQTWHCNGEPECVDGDDEKLCDCALDQFKCQYGGCIRQVEVCDGIEHCPDHSDEWNCLSSLSTIQRNETDAEIQKEGSSDLANELTGRPSLLKIRQFNEEHRLVCSDGWNEELSDSYCRSLGYASSETTTGRRWDGTSKILRLKSNPNDRAPLVTNLEAVDFCVSNEVVEVSCQEFSCGFHHAEGPTARLVGGTRAGEGQWTSVALLKENKYGSACTASILGPLHALASYSCVSRHKESSGWQLFTGGNLLKANLVKSIIPYPQVKYNQFLYNNDIALIELEEPLIFSRNVSAACLPTHPIQPRQICVTAGWRFPVNGEVDLQQYLEFLPVPTHESEKCNATSHYAGFITKYNICAGLTDTDKGPCYNDEGAPLMCVSESGRWEIQGLLSHHSRCSRGHPAIYSSLEPALLWLRNSVPALQA